MTEQILSAITFGDLAVFISLALIGLLAYAVTLRLISWLVTPLVRRANPRLAAALRQQRFERYVAMLAPPIALSFSLALRGEEAGPVQVIIDNAIDLFVIVIFALMVNALLLALESLVEPERKGLGFIPIQRLFQVLRVANLALAMILGLGVFYNIQLGWVLGSLGLLAAAASIVFGDMIYNVVARTILVSQKLVSVGDWIEISALGIDGQVREIGPFLVEVENWDKTLATVPPRYLLTNSFRSWQQMYQAGVRRMMRTLHLDLGSLRAADEAMLAEARALPGVAAYLDGRAGVSSVANVALYRAALMGYLGAHPQVHSELLYRVSDLDATGQGLPVLILAYLRETADLPYRLLDAEIYEHALVMARRFGLRVYQAPSGEDMRGALEPVAAIRSIPGDDGGIAAV